ncbi:MAG: ABC transporter ATP-binding protein [Proteobacteria bacterium]|nr:ABC transporter ATP-binding protein [Pseudomonadota bacterium]
MSAAPVLAVDAVGHTFPSGTTALTGVSLAIADGEFVALLGPSGCGKTTLLSLLAGLAAPTAGSIAWWGEPLPPPGRPFGYVFQAPTLMPWARVAANVRLPLELRGSDRATAQRAALAALARVGLAEFADAWPRELSGGMRMRASIARALVASPLLLLLDEPFAALDEFARNRLDDELSHWWRDAGFTAVFVTHSIQEAVFLATRVVVMAARPGRVIADLAIDAPFPRGPAWRASPAFATLCADISRRVAAAAERAA